jgi:hypothetical protein
MAVLRKQSFPENLETFSVLVNDTAENSLYFKITDLPDTFTGGKNSFLIQGSEDLVQDTVVKIEIKDSNGNVIYTEPGEGIPEYYEGTSKPVAVYIYPDTAYGPCTITILAELAEYVNERGVKTGVPTEWRNKYNIRWQKVVNVNPNLTNTSKIRFYRRPKVNITETVLPVYNRSVSRLTVSGSINGNAVQPAVGSNFRTFRGDTIYYLYTTSSAFSSSMEGENIIVSGLPQTYTATIKDVVNSSKLLVNIPYFETSSNLSTTYQTVTNFENAQFQVSYNENVSLSNSTINASYAKIRITDLEAFSGDPARLKVFSKRKADIGNYSLIEDVRLESNEIFIADSYSGSINVNTGQFTKQSIIDDFWTYSDLNGTTYNAEYDNVLLASSVKLLDNTIQNSSVYPQRIFYYKSSLDFNKNTEYEIDFVPFLSSSTFTPVKLEVYASGSAFVNTDIITGLGKRISTYELDGTSRRYDRQQLIFKPDSDGVGTIVFAVYQGNWQLSNVSLRASSETNFSPNEITLNVEVPTVVKNDEYEFRFEFYDVNNNYVPVNVVTSSVFTGGSTLEDVVGTARFLQVSPDSNLFPFGYLNNYDFQELSTFASVPIGATSIFFNIQSSGLTGSITFTSAAFDSGGVYINPATYTGQYPGFLTNVTTSSAILEVANFTGSMASTIEVRRIEYTASFDGFTDVVSIYKVIEGTPGSDGENGEQYIIKPLNGTAIKNSDPNAFIEVQLVKIFGNAALDIVTGDVKLVTGSSNTVISVGDGIVAGSNGVEYNAKFYAQKINGLLELKAYDFINNRIVDTISLADITDGLTTGFIEATNGLILNREPSTNLYTPTNTALTASFYDGLGNLYTSSVLVTPNYSAPNDQLKYQTGIVDPNINLDFVKTTAGVSVSNNTFVNTTGLTFKYTFTDPYSGGTVAASEGVIITTNGSSGTSGANGTNGTSGANGSSGTSGVDAAGKIIQVILEPSSQTVTRDTAGTYNAPAPFIVRVYEDGIPLLYNTSQPLSNGEFIIQITPSEGTDNSVDGALSGSIIPAVLSLPMLSSSVDFAIKYKTTDGLTESGWVSQSHNIGVALEGQSGPGVVFTGVWELNRFYQFGSGSTARRDVVLWSRNGLEPYDTYYATLKQHLSDSSTNSTGNGAPNYSTGSVGSAWQELGQEDYFVAAKIAIFEESFVKNTLNVGSSNNGGVSSANITIYGSGSYPYISMGQSSVIGSQGYGVGNGIFIGRDDADGLFKASFETSSSVNYLRWSGTALQISGTVSASEGQIGGVTLGGEKMYIGSGLWNNPNTSFYVDKAGYFSLEDKLTWDSINNYLNISGTIKAETGSFGGIIIGSNKIYTGLGVFGGTTTGFYVDSNGQFSLKDKLTWNGTDLNINGNGTFTGTVNASAGNFTGYVTAGTMRFGANVDSTNDGIWINSNNYWYDTSVFRLGGTTNFISWDGSSVLTVNGSINVTGGNAATNQNLSSSLEYLAISASNAAASASLSGSVNPLTQQIVKAATPSGQGLYLGSNYLGYYDGGAWSTYMSSSGDFYLSGSAENYLEWNSLSGSLNINGTINATDGNIGGWIIGETKLVSTNGSMSFDSSTSQIRLGSGSNDTTTVLIRSGELSARSANQEQITSFPEISTNAPATGSSIATTYSTSQTIGPVYGAAKSITILSTEEGSYTANITCSGLSTDNTIATKFSFAGAFSISLVIQIARDPSFSNVIYETGLGSGNYYGSTSSTSVTFNYSTNVPITLNLTAGDYHVRLKWTGSIVRSAGSVTINPRTSVTGDTITFNQDVAQTEIADGGFQAVRNVNRYVTINRVGTSDIMLEVGGDITATGNITAYYSSDKRLKENVIPIESALDKIDKINGVKFDWIQEYIDQKGGEDGYFIRKHDVGIIAQEIEEVLPEVVATKNDGYKAVRYEKLVALLIEGIKELKKEIDILKSKSK